MVVDVAYVGNRADDLLLFANFNQAAPNNAAGTIPLQARRPIPEFGDITYAFNGGKSRYHALQAQVRLARRARALAPQLVHAVAGEGQRRRLARESERQLPGAAGLLQPRRRLRAVGATTSRTTARPASSGSCRSAGPAFQQRVGLSMRCRRLADGGDQQHLRGRAGDVQLHAARRRSRSRASSRTSAAPTTTGPTSSAIRSRPRPSARSRTGSTATTSSCRPTRASRSATPSATACAVRTSGRSTWRRRSGFRCRGRHGDGGVPRSRSSISSTGRTSARPNGNRSAAAFGTITQTYDPRQMQLGFKVNF